MATDVKMPQLGESVTEGTVGRWLKEVGQPVARYEPLLEVVTDKVDTEVPAPVDGVLLEIVVAEGETVTVGTVIARLGTANEATSAAPSADPMPPPAAAPAAAQPHAVHEAPTAASASAMVNGPPNGYLSPVVARLIAEHQIDLRQLRGSGKDGRITKQDVLRYLEAPPAPTPAPEARPVAARPPAAVPTPAPAAVPTPAPAAIPTPVLPAELPADAVLQPLSPMRRAIAEHMVRSVRTSPHVTTVMEADLSAISAHRAANKAAFERQGVRLTFTAYFFHAVAAALGEVPILNGSYRDDGILLNRRINLGMAVALDEGLIVPVIHDADEKNLLGLARAVNDLAERARTRRLRPEETRDGTFTITNHGVSGSLFATPIINQPQAAILGIGAIVKRPVVVSQHGSDAIAIKPMCYLSLTFDHRIADGAVGDAMLGAVVRALEGYSG